MTKGTWRLFPAEEKYFPYLLLANLIIPVWALTLEPLDRMLAGLLLLLLFIVIYRQLYWTQGTSFAAALLTVQTIIALALAAFYHPMYAYIAFLISTPLSKQKKPVMIGIACLFGIGMLLVTIPQFHTYVPELWLVLLAPMFGVCAMPFIIRASANYKLMAEQLQAATAQIERMAQEEERQRIARELHDTLGHTLSLIALKSELTEKLALRAPEKAASEARDIRETARAALKQMRELVAQMKAVKLSDEVEHARTLCAAAGIAFTCSIQQDEETALPVTAQLTALQETILAMCFRELVTNAVRHSRAARCSLQVSNPPGSIRLTVQDDGIGIRSEHLAQPSRSGMIGLRERLSLINGALQVNSSPNEGTSLAIEIPLALRSHIPGGEQP